MIKRDAERVLLKLAQQFKAVAVVGPRQSGKTTLVRNLFGDKPYVSLENPDIRRFATEDPRGFLSQYPEGAILDEAQRVPELFSYMQQILDESNTRGKFILTGSNNFLLQENISQSLAGRVAYLFLLPFSINELNNNILPELNDFIYKGAYPALYDQPVEAEKWYPNYIRTYVERDIRLIKNILDLNVFVRFLRLCAARVGQLLNLGNLATETGVDSKTVASWLGILESSFITYRLQPHYKNFNKRLVKMSKLYFYDTGLVCSLLGIQDAKQLVMHPYMGGLFENLMINEFYKHRLNRALTPNLYFWRDNHGNEVDLIVENSTNLYPVEFKSGQTITNEYFKGIEKWLSISGEMRGTIIYAGNQMQSRNNGIQVVPWNQIHEKCPVFEI
jgi:hypothetical protein